MNAIGSYHEKHAETLTVISAHQMSMNQLELTGESQENIEAIDSRNSAEERSE